jgi:hypothetical protein
MTLSAAETCLDDLSKALESGLEQCKISFKPVHLKIQLMK